MVEPRQWRLGSLGLFPPPVYRIGFLEMHDTADCNPLADGLRGSRLVQALWAVMLFSGLTPATWNGQEIADHHILPRLLNLWQREPALRHGAIDWCAFSSVPSDIVAIRRMLGKRSLVGVVNLGALLSCLVIAQQLGAELLGLFPLSRERRGVSEELRLAAFGVCYFEEKTASRGRGVALLRLRDGLRLDPRPHLQFA